jgi:hypothetical protein
MSMIENLAYFLKAPIDQRFRDLISNRICWTQKYGQTTLNRLFVKKKNHGSGTADSIFDKRGFRNWAYYIIQTCTFAQRLSAVGLDGSVLCSRPNYGIRVCRIWNPQFLNHGFFFLQTTDSEWFDHIFAFSRYGFWSNLETADRLELLKNRLGSRSSTFLSQTTDWEWFEHTILLVRLSLRSNLFSK